MPGGQSCVKEEKKKMDGGDSIPGNVHEEQEDVEIVKVDCMCVCEERVKTGSFSLQKERNYSAQTHLKHFHLKDGFFKRKKPSV